VAPFASLAAIAYAPVNELVTVADALLPYEPPLKLYVRAMPVREFALTVTVAEVRAELYTIST
jgi:hypothetical protein